MDVVAQRLLEDVTWGLKMRLYTGAGLSMLDLFTDLFMIYTYMVTGQQGTAQSLASMVGLCLLFQCILVWGQTKKGSKVIMAREMLVVLSGIKPGIDAMRVANGTEQVSGAILAPELELTFTRSVEMFCESVPGKREREGSGVGVT
jgi:hypothetical protein